MSIKFYDSCTLLKQCRLTDTNVGKIGWKRRDPLSTSLITGVGCCNGQSVQIASITVLQLTCQLSGVFTTQKTVEWDGWALASCNKTGVFHVKKEHN